MDEELFELEYADELEAIDDFGKCERSGQHEGCFSFVTLTEEKYSPIGSCGTLECRRKWCW